MSCLESLLVSYYSFICQLRKPMKHYSPFSTNTLIYCITTHLTTLLIKGILVSEAHFIIEIGTLHNFLKFA